jgi:uncharacterized protein YukE
MIYEELKKQAEQCVKDGKTMLVVKPEIIVQLLSERVCLNCNGSGHNPGSEYLDCVKCDSANQRATLEKFCNGLSGYQDPDDSWAIHQRAYAMGVAEMREELAEKEDELRRADSRAITRLQHVQEYIAGIIARENIA